MVAAGARAVMLFLIQIGSARRFALARDIDPGLRQGLRRRARRRGRGHRLSLRDHPRRYRGGRAGRDRGSERVATSWAPSSHTGARIAPSPATLASLASLLTLRCSSGTGAARRRRGRGALMSYVDAALAPQRKTGQIKLHGPAAFEGMRKAGRLVAECLDMLAGEVRARRADREDRPAGVRLRHGPQGDAGDADVSRLPQGDLHLGQSRGLPRHPGREAAQGGRHRQRRRHAHPRRLARRFQPHVRGRRRSRAAPSG